MNYNKNTAQKKNLMLGIVIPTITKEDTLEQILKNGKLRKSFTHIVSLNPEILTLQYKRPLFKKAITTAQMRIIDGAGVVLASKILGIEAGDRLTGVDLTQWVLDHAYSNSLRVLLIGGNEKVAESVANCYIEKYPRLNIRGMMGIANIHDPLKKEHDHIKSIVADYKPHFVFVAFGSPWQEEWIEANKSIFGNSTVAGVGGAFDFIAHKTKRAPLWIRNHGLEWVYRLLHQPWRLKRQLNLVVFGYLILKQKLTFK